MGFLHNKHIHVCAILSLAAVLIQHIFNSFLKIVKPEKELAHAVY